MVQENRKGHEIGVSETGELLLACRIVILDYQELLHVVR
jgi:hypothetical protein